MDLRTLGETTTYIKKLGLILEDMHDENVLLSSNTLFFIDTVFFTITPID